MRSWARRRAAPERYGQGLDRRFPLAAEGLDHGPLVNLTNPMAMKGPLRELIPSPPQHLRVRVPQRPPGEDSSFSGRVRRRISDGERVCGNRSAADRTTRGCRDRSVVKVRRAHSRPVHRKTARSRWRSADVRLFDATRLLCEIDCLIALRDLLLWSNATQSGPFRSF